VVGRLMDLLTLGEAMGVYAAAGTGPLRVGDTSTFTFAGAESNVAIGMSRLGHDCTWLGRLGDDAAGRAIREALRGESVDVAHVVMDPDNPTALLLRERRTADHVRVWYHRRHSAGSLLRPEDVDASLVRSARLLHVTGITPALGESCAAAVRFAVQVAQESGVPVSFDVNYRSRLWSRPEAARALAYLVSAADILFAGLDEARLFLSGPAGPAGPDVPAVPEHPDAIATALAETTGASVVLKLGDGGALAVAGHVVHRHPAVPVSAVDPVGAGDAFVAGYLSAYLAGMSEPDRLERACVCGAFAVSCQGDWEGAPRLAELPLLSGDDVVR
jgi:2-dehydro-3-deoxygluconokinase